MLAAQGEGPVSEGGGVVSFVVWFLRDAPRGVGSFAGSGALACEWCASPGRLRALGALSSSGDDALAAGVGFFHSLQPIVDLLQGDLRGIYLRGSGLACPCCLRPGEGLVAV